MSGQNPKAEATSRSGGKGLRFGLWTLLMFATLTACWLAALQGVLGTGKQGTLPVVRIVGCAAIGLGAVAAARMSASAMLLTMAWSVLSWSWACAIAHLSKSDIMFGHYQGPFRWIQSATVASWFGLSFAVLWLVWRLGFDGKRWTWKMWVFGVAPLALLGFISLPIARDVSSWQEQLEREELSNPHSPRSEIRHINAMLSYAETKPYDAQSWSRLIKILDERTKSPDGRAYLERRKQELKAQGKLSDDPAGG